MKQLTSYQAEGIKTSFEETVEEIGTKEQAITTDKSVYYYDRLIIATGSRAIVPPLKGARLPGTYTFKSLDDMDRLLHHKASKVVVVGSGNIGLEAAQAMQDRGCQVSIIESREQIMPRLFDRKPAEIIENMLDKTGIQVFTSESVMEVQGENQVEAIITNQRTIPCDTLIWAVGLAPECQLAADAGIELGQTGGIKVDRHLRCNIDNIYACGDCAETYDMVSGLPVLSMLWPSARQQARVAAQNCIGIETEYEGAFSLVVDEIDDKPIAALGLKEDSPGRQVQVIEGENDQEYWRIILDNQRIIGMQIIGELRQVGIVAGMIKNKNTLTEIANIMRNPELKMVAPWLAEAVQKYPLI